MSPVAFGLAYNTAYQGTDPDLVVAAARYAEKCGFESFYRRCRRTSSASLSASPMKLKATTVKTMQIPAG